MLVLLGVLAWAYPPDNKDMLTYHLPRVARWIQQGSVAHFPTENTRQIESGPWAGFVLIHLELLYGSDRLANLAQFFAFLTCAVAGSFLAEQLWEMCLTGQEEQLPAEGIRRLRRRIAALACLLIVSVPMAVLESLTAQTDMVVCCWLVCFVTASLVLVLKYPNWWSVSLVGASLGAGALSKATFYIYAAPFVLLLGGWVLRRWKERWLMALGLAAIFLAVNLPHFQRNLSVFGSPLGSKYVSDMVRNEHLSVGGTLSNLIRNLYFALYTGCPSVDRMTAEVLGFGHVFTGLDLNEPGTTFPGTTFNFFRFRPCTSDYSSSSSQLGLIAVAVLLMFGRPGRRLFRMCWLPVSVGASFLIFCLYLRWQPWHMRLMMPYLVVLMPWVAVIWMSRMPRLLVLLAVGFTYLQTVHCLLFNLTCPFSEKDFREESRAEQYFGLLGKEREPWFSEVAEHLTECGAQHVGMKIRFNDLEYPFWVALRARGFQGTLESCFLDDAIPHVTAPPLAIPEAVIIHRSDKRLQGITNQYPHKVTFSVYDVYWSASASSRARLTQFIPEDLLHPAEKRVLKAASGSLSFRGELGLVLQGTADGELVFDGQLHATGASLNLPRQLEIKPEAGSQQVVELNGARFRTSIMVKAGRESIKIRVLPVPGKTLPYDWTVEQFNWQWRPQK